MEKAILKPGWKVLKFGDFAENIAVRVDPAKAETDIYVGLEHLDPSTLHLREWGKPSDVSGQKLAFKKGDVIFGRRRAYQRKLAIAEFDGICSAHAMVVRAKPKEMLPEFLPFFLQSDLFMERAIGISVGSLSPTINWKTLRVQEFALPPIEEQKRIATVLWAADDVIEKWRVTAAKIDQLRQSSLDKHFPCNVTDQVAEYANGEIRKLADLAKVYSGGTPSRKNSSYWENGTIPWIKTGEVAYFDIHDAEEKITEQALAKSAAKLVPPDTTLVAMYGQGPTRGRVGYCTIEAAINQACAAIVVDRELVRPRFVYQYLGREYESIRSMAHGAAQPNINVSMVKNFSIPVPPLTQQDHVIGELAAIDERLDATMRHIRVARDSASTLLNSLVEGEHV